MPPVLATFTLECFMCLAQRFLVKVEQLPQCIQRKMSLSVLLLIYHGRRKSLLICLSLENLFLNRPRRYEPVHKT